MFPQVSATLEEAIDGLEIPVDRRALTTMFGLLDKLTAKLTEAVGEVDRAEQWRDVGAASMTQWLRSTAGRSTRDAAWYTHTAARLHQLPVTAEAWTDGTLSTGQLQPIIANLSDKTLAMFADQEADLVPSLSRMHPNHAVIAMRHWRRRAQALLDDDEPAQPERSLHLSETMDGRRELSGSLDTEAGAVVAKALELAHQPDLDGEPARTPARRRADALVDIARFFLDNQTTNLGGRDRPHLNVFVNYNDIVDNHHDELSGLADIDQARHKHPDRALGWLADGTVLDAASIRRLLCDAGIHRIVTKASSAILDYGTTTRTISAAVFAALVARDHHCRFPGCDRPPKWCEAHHLQPWEHGGETSIFNLILLCSRHHHLLHGTGWHAKMTPNGDLEITNPNGHVLQSTPPGRPPDLFDNHPRRPAA